ncbi:MAG: hypothetical protein WCV99_08340 [Sterolibacterium sp.]|jgi:hypothetical protein
MAIGSSTSSIQTLPSATQDAWQQLRLQQAKRDADRAERTAESLQAQAQDAKRVALRADETARSLSVQADQAQSEAGKARQGVASLSSLGQLETLVDHVSDQVTQRLQSAQQTASVNGQVSASATPVVNTQGQVTGTVVNTTA